MIHTFEVRSVRLYIAINTKKYTDFCLVCKDSLTILWFSFPLFCFQIHSFSKGDVVEILEDVNSVRELQEGHGGWNDDMLVVSDGG